MAVTVGIGGSGSGSGKTALACLLLERLRGWGAVKYSPSGLYSLVTDDPVELRQNGKDTARFLEAGAGAALLVLSTPADIGDVLGMALYRLSGMEGVIVEGNGAIEVLKPDIVIFTMGGKEMKKSAHRVLEMADVLIAGHEAGLQAVSSGAARFQAGDIEGYTGHVLRLIDEKKDKR